MILQELHAYYERLLSDDDPACDVPERHWSMKKASWVLELSDAGKLLGAYPLMTGEGRDARQFKSLCVPDGARSGPGIAPFFLCDNVAYLLGYDEEHGAEKLAAARELHKSVLATCDDAGAQAVLRFFEQDDRDIKLGDAERSTLMRTNGFAVFRLKGDLCYMHERPMVAAAWTAYCDARSVGGVVGQCAVTGKESLLARLFPQITGIPGAQSAGTSLVSFNLQSFDSYGKSQAYNASISEEVAFNAGSALRYLYSNRSHRLRIGNTTVLFWADKTAPIEDALMRAMLDPDEFDGGAEDSVTAQKVRRALECIERGLPLQEIDTETRYFVLGLVPSAARLAVRFFETGTLGRLAENFGMYLCDVRMVDVRMRSLRALLLQTAPLGKDEQLPSTLVNGCMNAMLTGAPFPQALYYTVLSRMRCDHARNKTWDMGERAALLKACLVRRERMALTQINERGAASAGERKGLDMYLDTTRTNRGYVLGRLFAVMERAQQSALDEVTATIRDRYIGAASTTPARVFPHLLHNMQNHLAKLRKSKPGLCVTFEKTNDEIMGLLDGPSLFPKTLDTEDQGEFFVGYYQQRVDLWKSHKDDNSVEDTNAAISTETN